MVAHSTQLPSTAIRITRLTVKGHGPKTLKAAEDHGKRQDASSLRRRVNDAEPVIFGGLDLEQLFAAHTAGCRMDKRMTSPVMHCIVQWPTGLVINDKNERAMLNHARNFLNDLLGGEAVFAARLDRDEKGKHVVDVFCSPIVTKNDGSRWVQTQKHLKALCERHRQEIERRHPTIKDITTKRGQGMALQSEWRAYVESMGFKLPPKREKRYGQSDWLTPEQYALEAQRKALTNDQVQLEQERAELEMQREELEFARSRVQRLEMQAADLVRVRGGDPYPEATAMALRRAQRPPEPEAPGPEPAPGRDHDPEEPPHP